MVITHVDTNTAQGTVSTFTPLSITKPTGTAENDIIILIATWGGFSSGYNVATPTGFTLLNREVTGSFKDNYIGTDVFYKVATDSEGSSYDMYASASSLAVAAAITSFRGCDTTDPIGNSSIDEGDSSSFTAPGINIATIGNGIIHYCASMADGTSISPPSGFAELGEIQNSGDVREEHSWDTAESTGGTGDKSASGGNDRWIAGLIELNLGADPPEYDQLHYRWRNDDGSESAATWMESEDTTHSGSESEARVRFLVDLTNGIEDSNTFTIEYSDNASTWEELTTVSAASANADLSSDNFNDNSFDTSIWGSSDLDYGGTGSITEQNQRLEFSGSTGTTQYDSWQQRIHQDSVSGDYDVQVKIVDEDLDSGSGYTIRNLLIISNAAAGGSAAYIGHEITDSLDRLICGIGDFNATSFAYSYPYYLRIKYQDGTIYLYSSQNGTSWTLRKSGSLSAANARYVIYDAFTITGDTTSVSSHCYIDDFQNNVVGEDPPVYIRNSTNITNGAATTAQLSAPAGKTTGDFEAGDILDTSDTSDAITVSSGSYTEYEWSIGFNTTSGTYYFRIADLDTYTETYAAYTLELDIIQRTYSLWYRKSGVTYEVPLWDSYGGFTDYMPVRYNNETSYAELATTGDSDATDLRIRKDGTTYAFVDRS